jgi:DNA-directed RNA polymerase subunit RPC12/RpoP
MGQRETDGLQVRTIKSMLECAVKRAKRLGRNRVVEYDHEMSTNTVREGRADCAKCGATFSVSIDLMDPTEGDLYCPDCGSSVERPHGLKRPDVRLE